MLWSLHSFPLLVPPTQKTTLLNHHQIDDSLLEKCAPLGDPPVVLHVEDDQEFSAALRCRLEAHGVAVVRAFDGDEGIRQSRVRKLDAILIDYELPNANGEKVLEALREHESTKYLPVIVITGRKDKQLKLRMQELGASAHLTKPVKFDDLRKQLARHIDILPQPSLS